MASNNPTCKPPLRPRLVLTDVERQHIRDCLDLLQQAQNLCDSAAQSLCNVRGFANEWSALTKPYDAVKAAWYKVESRRTALVQKGGAR
ncbi:MAG: hypothetical protein HYV60_20685 [Planctomycetia bacterium]|nr:hypothetical protein [Planctomycetia bacterium]